MNKNKPNKEISRRTGLDRRWIPSKDHCPDRRRSNDRRKIKNRSFLEPIETNDTAENRKRLPEIDYPADPPEEENAVLPFGEKKLFLPRESDFTRVTSDDE